MGHVIDRCITRGGFRGSSLGSLKPPFLKLAMYQQTLTELADTHSSSLELSSAVQSRKLPKLDPRMCAPPLKWVIRGVVFREMGVVKKPSSDSWIRPCITQTNAALDNARG